MRKINYEQASLICLYDSIEKTISELELHYKLHPYEDTKREILSLLEQQKDYLKLMKKSGLNNYFLKSLSVNAKRLAAKHQLKEKKKIVSGRKIGYATTCLVSLLSFSLLFHEPIKSELMKKYMNYDDADFSSLMCTLFGEMETETFEVKLEPVVSGPIQQKYEIKTLVYDKYYNVPCSKELQNYFYELEEKWGIPARVAMALVDKESDGKWSTNGVISPTDDYGLSQINIRNHAYIKRELGYTTEEILNDPYKNLDAMFLLLTCVFNQYGYTMDDYDLLNVAGAYNGWTTWESKEQSVEYANECVNIYNTKFTKVNDVKLLVLENTK